VTAGNTVPSLSVVKSPDGQTVQAGETVTFTITGSASPGGGIGRLDLSDSLPGDGLSWGFSGTATGIFCSLDGAGGLSCNNPGVGTSITFSVSVSAVTDQNDCGTLLNTVQVTFVNTGGTIAFDLSVSDTGTITVEGCDPPVSGPPQIDPIDLPPPPPDIDLPQPEQPFTAQPRQPEAPGEEAGAGPLVDTGDSGSGGASPVRSLWFGLVGVALSLTGVAFWLSRRRILR
jgi:hypothetical protein